MENQTKESQNQRQHQQSNRAGPSADRGITRGRPNETRSAPRRARGERPKQTRAEAPATSAARSPDVVKVVQLVGAHPLVGVRALATVTGQRPRVVPDVLEVLDEAIEQTEVALAVQMQERGLVAVNDLNETHRVPQLLAALLRRQRRPPGRDRDRAPLTTTFGKPGQTVPGGSRGRLQPGRPGVASARSPGDPLQAVATSVPRWSRSFRVVSAIGSGPSPAAVPANTPRRPPYALTTRCSMWRVEPTRPIS
jgi:hypothetical protein